MAQSSRSRGNGAVNPDELTLNPRNLYPDGIIEGYTNPVFAKTVRPRGSAYLPSSDSRKTFTERRLNRPGGRRMVLNRGFARDITKDPWGTTQGVADGGPLGPAPVALAHDASPEALADPRSHGGRTADNAQEVAAPGYTVGPSDLGSMAAQIWSGGPVVKLLIIGAAGTLVAGLLGAGPFGSVARGAGGVGRSTARVGSEVGEGARETGGAAMSGINQAFGSAVEALDKATPGGRR